MKKPNEDEPVIRNHIKPLAIGFGAFALFIGIISLVGPLSAALLGEKQRAAITSRTAKPIGGANNLGDFEYTVLAADGENYILRADTYYKPNQAIDIKIATDGTAVPAGFGSLSNYNIRSGLVIIAFGLMWIALAFAKKKPADKQTTRVRKN